MTLDELLKFTQIAFFITAGVVAVLTFIKAKNGLLNSVNTEYKKRIMDHLADLSEELYSEFDEESKNFWAKSNTVEEILERLHKIFRPYKTEIIKKKQPPPGIPISSKERILTGMLDKYKSDPFIPLSIRDRVTSFLNNRVSSMKTIFTEEIDKYKRELAEGKHWESLDENHNWVHNRINERLYKEGYGISQIHEEIHSIRDSIRIYLEGFDPIKKKR